MNLKDIDTLIEYLDKTFKLDSTSISTIELNYQQVFQIRDLARRVRDLINEK